MLIRRISHRAREHDWFLSLLDLSLLVAGIFLGLQASEWNNARLEAKRVEAVMVRIEADLEGTAKSIDSALFFHRRAISDLDAIERGIQAGQVAIEDVEAVERGLATMDHLTVQDFSSAVLRDFVASTDLASVRDNDLRFALANFAAYGAGVQTRALQARSNIESAVDQLSRHFVFGTKRLRNTLWTGVDDYDLDGLQRDPQSLSNLRRIRRMHTTALALTEGAKSNLEELRKQFAESKKRG